jgi:transcription initiation factor TFIIIB Brf1 subunit/transcription initiation factor TFIIB
MKCSECGSLIFNYNERMGETECSDCGLVVVTELFEETVRMVDNGVVTHSADKGRLGSIITGKGSYQFNRRGNNSTTPRHILSGIQTCNMILSSIQINHPLKERVEECYLDAQRKGLFGKIKLEARCTATVFYVLKENRTPVSMKELCSEYSCSIKVVNRLSQKMINHFRNRNLLYGADPTFMLKQVCSKVTDDIMFYSNAVTLLEKLEPLVEVNCYNKSRGYYAAVCWVAVNVFRYVGIKKGDISESTGISLSAIGKTSKALIKMLGYDKMSEVKGMVI